MNPIQLSALSPRKRRSLPLLVTLLIGSLLLVFAEPPLLNDDTKVYWDGGNRGHVDGCSRLPKDAAELAKLKTSTYGAMTKAGAQLCSRCPGSTTAGKGNPQGEKKNAPSATFDPKTQVIADALWFRVHARDCPHLILKDKKKTLTLQEADEAGYRIGETGQSGRETCCLTGYQRKHPERKFSDDTILAGNQEKRNVKHLPGCHRYWPDKSDLRRPLKDWVADGFAICPHCIERGPSDATISDAAWARLGAPQPFTTPAGWTPQPFSPNQLPPPSEVDLLIRETLAMPNGIQELPFTDPVAAAEHFLTMRFFFPVENWLHFYKAYRSTGDKRLLGKLLESARHYHRLVKNLPGVAQHKARDPEGMPFLYSMAASARITLQWAKKHPGSVSPEELAEAEDFLTAMLSVLKPICEDDAHLDPVMGIPQTLADDFRTRAFNRSMNGMATLAMMTAALEDLQAVKGTNNHQPAIARYRRIVHEYVKYWFSIADLVTTPQGEKHFVYPYKPEPTPKIVEGSKIYQRAEDAGHFSHTLQGVVCLYESAPHAGIDDTIMTAIAHAVYRSSTEKVQVGKSKKLIHSGHIESPVQARLRPNTQDGGKGHQYGAARDRFYLLEAFKTGMIDGLCITLQGDNKTAVNSTYEKRLATLHVHYMKALRENRRLIHLGEKMP
jgi:hypothetical protein